jgi:hypothetical protein
MTPPKEPQERSFASLAARIRRARELACAREREPRGHVGEKSCAPSVAATSDKPLNETETSTSNGDLGSLTNGVPSR